MPGRRMTNALILVALIGALYAGILALLWHFQERIVFQPPANPESQDVGTGTIEYSSPDSIRLVAHLVEGSVAGPLVVAFHGNAMISRWMIPWARELSRRTGATVVLPEYRGYDGLSGVPTYEGAQRDARAALDAIRQHFQSEPADMVFYGHSLGSAVATELASDDHPRALVLESPFTSVREMAGRWPLVGLGVIWKTISRVHYDTRSLVARHDFPVHVSHGERDVIVPVRMGRAVHAAARRPGGLLLVPEAGHNDVAIAGGDDYWRWIAEAIRQPAR